MSFLMIVSLAYVTIEVADPEPALAASWDCLDASGRPIAFQTKYDSGNLNVIQYNFTTNSETTTTFTSGFAGSGEINAAFMDLDGNLYVQRKHSNSNGVNSRLYLVNPTGNPTLVDSSSAGEDLNAATFFVDNGYEYAISGRGHFAGPGSYVRFSSGSDTSLAADKLYSLGDTSTSGGSIKRSKAKDFTWIRDNSSFPTMFNGLKPSFIGIDGGNQRIYVSSYTITNQGNSNEAIEIETQSYSVSIPSSDRTDFGAVYGFGSDELYAMNNASGNIYKISTNGSSYSISDSGDDGATTSNNDGAACHAGDPTVTFVPDVTAVEGSCDGSNRQIDVTLTNTSSNVAASFVVTYTISGSGTNLTSTVSASSEGSVTVPGQANGTVVTLSWYAENSDNDLRTPITGTSDVSSPVSSSITIDASSCSSDPTAVSITASQSLGSCSDGSASSSFQFANSSGSTAYVTVEYSTDGGSTWSVHPQAQANTSNDLVISSGSTPGTLSSISVSHGSSIKWRYKSTDTEGDWTGISYVDGTSNSNLNSSTVNCATATFTITDALGSCSAGSAVPSATITNTANGSIFVDLQYKLTLDGSDISDWNDNLTGFELAQGDSITRSLSAQQHGYQITWRARADASSDPTSGSYTSPDGTA